MRRRGQKVTSKTDERIDGRETLREDGGGLKDDLREGGGNGESSRSSSKRARQGDQRSRGREKRRQAGRQTNEQVSISGWMSERVDEPA